MKSQWVTEWITVLDDSLQSTREFRHIFHTLTRTEESFSWAEDRTQLVEFLPSMCKALGSGPSTAKPRANPPVSHVCPLE